MPQPPFLLLLRLLVAAAAADAKTTPPPVAVAAGAGDPPPAPTPWPEQFHAVVFTNLTESGGRLQLIDLYYDWPGGRNLNLIRNQLSGDPLYDVEWTNGTSYIFDSASCRTIRVPVGILPPDWLAGAVYLGREATDGFDCHVWTKVDFVWYYEDVATGRPVRWNFFNGMQQHVMSFEVGGVLEDPKWQAPAYCFKGDNADDTANAAAGGVDGDGGRPDVMNSLIRLPPCSISHRRRCGPKETKLKSTRAKRRARPRGHHVLGHLLFYNAILHWLFLLFSKPL